MEKESKYWSILFSKPDIIKDKLVFDSIVQMFHLILDQFISR